MEITDTTTTNLTKSIGQPPNYATAIEGVLFRRSIRSSYAALDIAFLDPSPDATHSPPKHVVVVIEFGTNKSLRSEVRRFCRIGDFIGAQGTWDKGISCQSNDEFLGETKEETQSQPQTQTQTQTKARHRPQRLNIESISYLTLKKANYWDAPACQSMKELFYPETKDGDQDGTKKHSHQNKKMRLHSSASNEDEEGKAKAKSAHSGGGVGKRKQADILAAFFVQCITSKLFKNQPSSQSTSQSTSQQQQMPTEEEKKEKDETPSPHHKVIDCLNQGSGVIDAAGGSGHVSLSLSLLGIQSTVIDPRENVGRLPMRDRKVFRKAKRKYDMLQTQTQTQTQMQMQMQMQMKSSQASSTFVQSFSIRPPPIPFATKRAWFMNKPQGVDVHYREGIKEPTATSLITKSSPTTPPIPPTQNDTSTENENNRDDNDTLVPICTMCSPDRLLSTCSAVIALHPDEATEPIVDFAVQHQIPFVVVPCCVFSRLFPNRLWKGSTVTSYHDFLDYLASKHSSIQKSQLDFEGANIAVWSTFE